MLNKVSLQSSVVAHLADAAEHLPQFLLPLSKLAPSTKVAAEVGGEGVHNEQLERVLQGRIVKKASRLVLQGEVFWP